MIEFKPVTSSRAKIIEGGDKYDGHSVAKIIGADLGGSYLVTPTPGGFMVTKGEVAEVADIPVPIGEEPVVRAAFEDSNITKKKKGKK